MRKSALQIWVGDLSMMQQSVIMSAVRGPDGLNKHHPTKMLLRWYRRCILISAFDGKALLDPYHPGGGSFTGPIPGEFTLEDVVDEYFENIDQLPLHYHLHFMHAAEIVGYKHSDEETKEFWNSFYEKAVKHLHLTPETEEEMDYRLGDVKEQWLDASN